VARCKSPCEKKQSTPSIVRDTQWALTNLPPGEPIVIAVAARNRSGESAAREVAVTIPAHTEPAETLAQRAT
jgi:hypothetical protein